MKRGVAMEGEGLILLFQCGGREWGVAVADENGGIGSGIWMF